MPYLRYRIDLSVPLVGTDADELTSRLPAGLQQKPTSAQLAAMADMTWLEIIKEVVKRLKAMSQRVERLDGTEEPGSLQAFTHICNHDIGGPCQDEVEIE